MARPPKRDITQAELARRCHTSQGHLSNVLMAKDRPSWRLAKAIAKECACSPVVIMEGSEEQIDEAIAEGRFRKWQSQLNA